MTSGAKRTPLTFAGLLAAAIWSAPGLAGQAVPPRATALPDNRWTKVAEVPTDPLGRELDPGRGAFWSFEPGSGRFLRYGGYTPTDGNALSSFDLAARKWENLLTVDYSWPPPADRPGAGAWWSMAWDGRRKIIWMCGGSGVAARKHPELFNDIWQYDPARKSFRAMKAKGFPAFSGGCRIVYDSKNDLVIRAPAYDGEWSAMCNRDRTWVYSPAKNAWEGRQTPKSPKSALAAVLVFDASAGKAVYLARGKNHVADTWTYDAGGNAWARVETAERPAARVVAGAAYDPENKQVLVCGGVGHAGKGYGYLFRGGGVQLTDTWALDLTKSKWKKLEVGAPVVPALPAQRGRRFEHFCAMDYDAKNRTVVLSAPTVGVWALRYRPKGAAALPALKLAALPAPPKPAVTKKPVFKMAPANKKLLGLAPGSWVKLDGGPAIGGGEVPMIYDEATGYCLKYGGCNSGGTTFASGYSNDLSAYDPATERWIALRSCDPCGPPRPANGCTRSYAHDPVRKVNWFAGGTSGNQLSHSLPRRYRGGLESGTWCYDGLRDRFGLVPSRGKVPHNWDRVVSCYDRGRNLFVYNAAHVFDPAAKAWAPGGEGIPVMVWTYACYAKSLKGMFVVRPEKNNGKWTYHAVVYDAGTKSWRKLAAGGGLPELTKKFRPMTAYDPGNDAVLCVLKKQTYVYDLKGGTGGWRALPAAEVDVDEMLVFDTRHKVFLATGAMGKHVWAFRYK
ncbi:MAG: Kelch repeat-containing protein [Planctomycetota bacterium]